MKTEFVTQYMLDRKNAKPKERPERKKSKIFLL
jgi:hypothetical protein